MNEPIIYLKNAKYGIEFSCFNKKTLSRINVYRDEECNIEKYDNEEDFNWNVKRDLSGTFEITDRESFDTAFISFTKNLNDLSKEL